MNAKLITIDITDDASLLEACDFLHDARCNLSTLQIDQANGTWKARFEREFFEDPSVMTHERKFFVFTKTTFPLVESELTFKGFSRCQIDDKSRIEIFTFNECRIDKNIATLHFCEDMRITVEFVDKPQGKLADLRLLDKPGTMYVPGFRGFKEKC